MFIKYCIRYFISHDNSSYDFGKVIHKYKENKHYWLKTNKQINICVSGLSDIITTQELLSLENIFSGSTGALQIYLFWLFEKDKRWCTSKFGLDYTTT